MNQRQISSAFLMSIASIIFLLLPFQILAAVETPTRCGQGEMFDKCTNLCVQPNCQGIHLPCPKNCHPGCKCKDNYLRKYPGKGPCVLKDKCRASNCTGAHEFWYDGTNWCCPLTCEDPNSTKRCKCILNGGACNCVDGYIRSKPDGPCIPADQCPTTCSRNEVFSISGAFCCDNLKTCDTPNRPCNRACTQGGGCVCAPGHIRAVADGPCIPKNKCCQKAHEVWNQCANGCEPTCKNRSPICPQFCPEDGGCKCDADNGFIRDNSSGECIKKEACTKKKCAGKKK